MDYYIHYTDGTTQVRHWCDKCDCTEALFYKAHARQDHDHYWKQSVYEQLCRDCFQDLDNAEMENN
jgi:hypothetical protein